MWAVSDRFLRDIAAPHTIRTTVTITAPGQAPITARIAGGSVGCDRTQRIRRTAQLVLAGDDTLFATLSTPGTLVAVTHGLSWAGNEQELVPMIVGELSSAAKQIGEGLISVSVADLWQRVVRSAYLSAYSPPTGARRVDQIAAAILDAVPATSIVNSSTDTGTIAVTQAWTSRADMVTAFATDGGSEAFFAPDGSFTIRDQPTIGDQPVWLFKGGPGGTITGLSRTRPLDQLFNTVVVQPASVDDSQSWTQVVAQITDPSNPRHPSIIGVAPYVWTAPTIITADQAATVAGQLLFRLQGTTETMQVDAVANPALEAGDIIRTLPPDADSAPVTHYLDSFTVDLATGAMTVNTRSNLEVTAV